jgi:hypothetical protein
MKLAAPVRHGRTLARLARPLFGVNVEEFIATRDAIADGWAKWFRAEMDKFGAEDPVEVLLPWRGSSSMPLPRLAKPPKPRRRPRCDPC